MNMEKSLVKQSKKKRKSHELYAKKIDDLFKFDDLAFLLFVFK